MPLPSAGRRTKKPAPIYAAEPLEPVVERAVGLLVLAAVFSGCAGSGNPLGENVTREPRAPVGEALVSDTRGAIDGRVVDLSLLPVPNATVSLREPRPEGAELGATTTAEDGRFVFDLLEPGSYRVTAAKPGFANTTHLAGVVAGEATPIRLILGEVPSDEPFVSLQIQAGIISCGWAIVAASGVCLPYQTEPVFGPFKIELYWAFPVGHQAAVSESDWQPRSQVMRHFFFRDETQDRVTDGDWMGDAMGPAILRKEFQPGVIPSSFTSNFGEATPFPPSEQNFTLLSITYYDGSYQQELQQLGGPACAYTIVGYCTGVGVTFQQRYTQYLTIFVNQVPDAIEAYSAVPDG